MSERITAPHESIEERNDYSLRPRNFSEFIGQEKTKENLAIFIEAASRRSQALDHVLLSGPPGLGKTSLAHVISNTLGSKIHCTSGPIMERTGDLAAILSGLDRRDVLFIDEIHRLNRAVEEMLYSAMEDYRLDVLIGEGPSARSVQISIPEFTLIGATTRTGLLTSPLRSRFPIQAVLTYYSPSDIQKIIHLSAQRLRVETVPAGARAIALRSRGTPRVANRLLRRVRDWSEVRSDGVITEASANQALEQFEVDPMGLDPMDRRILKIIIDHFKGGPVGIDTLSSILSEEPDTLEEVYEPFLIQTGFLARTPRGRIVTDRAYLHLGLTRPETQPEQASLF